MKTESHKFRTDELILWQKQYGRNNLPWQNSHDPYCRWLAEIMLQQTQVKTVIPYFEKFMQLFPTVKDLADAEEDEVMAAWSGLGYYSRARNLHACAKIVIAKFDGRFPLTLNELMELPGIGKSTAGAILSAVTNKPAPMLDGNVKRVFSRFFAVNEEYGTGSFEKLLWRLAEKNLPESDGRAFSQGLMDLGAMVCSQKDPLCTMCPVSGECLAFKNNQVLQYPVKKKGKEKPTRIIYWKVFIKDNCVWLEKRNGKGVWKGLWSFPESETKPSDAFVEKTIYHEFSHYKLQARLAMMESEEKNETGEGGWFSVSDLKSIGLPTPVKKVIFEELFL